MASVPVSHLILFIASIIIASSVAGVGITSVSEVSQSITDQSLDVSKSIETDVEIISDAGSPVYNTSGNENVTVLVKNTGTRTIPAADWSFDILLDGEYQTAVSVTVVDGTTWRENNVVEVEIDAGALSTGDHRLKLIVHGDEEVFEFRV